MMLIIQIKDIVKMVFISVLAEVPRAAGVNLQPAEHFKNVFFSFYDFKPPRPRGEGAGVKPAPKPSLDR